MAVESGRSDRRRFLDRDLPALVDERHRERTDILEFGTEEAPITLALVILRVRVVDETAADRIGAVREGHFRLVERQLLTLDTVDDAAVRG